MNFSVLKFKVNKRIIAMLGDKNYESYEEALKNCENKNGYENKIISKALKIKTIKFRERLDDNSIVYNIANPNIFALSSLLNELSIDKEILNVLDFGGGNGGHYLEILKINPQLKLRWKVIETSEMVFYISSFSDEFLTFHDDLTRVIEESKTIDVLYTSCTILYTPDPYKFIEIIVNSGAKYIIFNRQSLSKTEGDIIRVQNSLLSWHGSADDKQKDFKDSVIQYPQISVSIKKFEKLVAQKYDILYTFNDNSGLLPEQPNKNLIGKSYVLKLKNT